MKKLFTLRYLLLFLVFVAGNTVAVGQISLTTTNGSYPQNFDVMGSTGTAYPSGWTGIRHAGSGTINATLTPIADNGNANSGNIYNVGTTGASDRALGTLGSGSTSPAFGASFINNTSTVIADFTLTGVSEQWRTGSSNTVNETVIFEYSTNATSLFTGTWTTVTSLNLVELQTSTTSAGAIDGNLTANKLAISGSIAAVNLNVGGTIWIRWRDTDATGSDGMYALDDLVLNYTNAAPPTPTVNLSVSSNSGTEAGATVITVTATASQAVTGVQTIDLGVTGTNITAGDYTLSGTTITIANGATTGTVTFTVVDDAVVEGPETATLTISNPSSGITLGSTTTQNIVITDNDGAAPALTLTSALADFGNVCINTTAGPNSFTLDGSNLDGTNINIAALAGYTYSETSGGTYSNTLSFSYTGNSFTGKIIYVKFTPTAVQSYNGNINISGGGVSSFNVAVTGAGINTLPSVTTGTSSNVTATTATITGTINVAGCSPITDYGFFYSPNSGFPNGQGTRVSASNLSGGNFSYNLTGLSPNVRYYYKAYATNGTDTAYGAQQAFTNEPLPVHMASQPGLSFTENFADIANWGEFFSVGIGANHFDGLSATGAGGIPNGTTLTASTTSFQTGSSGGVQKGTTQAPATQSIVLLSTGATDNTSSAAIDFYMDFTGVNAGTLSFDWASVNNSTGDRKGSMRVYGSIDGTTFTEIPAAAVLNFTNNILTNGSITNIALPASFNNNANARLRFYYYNGTGGTTGSRPKISIDNLTVTAVPSTPCNTPTSQPTSMVFGTKTDVSIQGSFTAASPSSDQYLTVISTNSSLTSNPVDGVTYNTGDELGDGTVIAKGSSLNFTATGLSPSTTYYFFTFAVNGVCTGGPKYLVTNPLTGNATTNAAFPPCVAPASQASQLIFSNVTTNSLQGSFTATTADEYLVLKSTSSSLSQNPVNGQVYNAGDIIGNASVVQRNNNTAFTASGLAPGTTYYFYIFSLNSQSCINGPTYNLVSPLIGSQATQPLPPCATPTSQPTYLTLSASNNAVAGTFTASASADNYLIVRSINSTLSAMPSDNTDYTIGASLGGGVVIANSPATSFLTNNLSAATTYYFFVFAANKNCSGGTKYLTTSPLTANITTTNTPQNNFYFGSLHSHSDYSDGNQDRPGYTPADDYAYAMTAQCMDFLGISEHNHFATGTTLANYRQGVIQANNFTAANPGFIALYGMEWGVISNGGHVVIYGDGMDDLFGWESGSGAWGAGNNYDVYVANRDYTGPNGLFKTINDYVGKNTFATLAHPSLNDFNNLANGAYNAVADSAITGAAVESGPAFSTNTTYSNPASPMYYLPYYDTLLSRGYHLGPSIDHDNHNTTFGKTTYSRTAVIAPAKTKTEIIKGMRDMHFYATEDCDTKVDFTVNTRIMGSVFSDRNAPVISVNLSDATTSTSSAIIRVMYGTPGNGIMPVKIDSAIGSTLYFVDNNLPNGATRYYYISITNGTSRIVTSPIWYTRTCSNITSVNKAACGSYTWPSNGVTYTTSGSYVNTYSVLGCNNSDTLHLTINNANTGDTTATSCNSFTWYGTTYTTSGAKTHTLRNINGCDSVVTLNLTISANINVTVNSSTKCSNDPAVNITATPSQAGTYNYSWTVPPGATNPGNVASFAATVAGTYTVTITDPISGCSGTGSGTLTVNPSPTVTVNSPARCASGSAVTISATPSPGGTYNYVWTVPSGAANPGNVASFSATVSGTYTVVITNATTGCTATGSGTLTVNQNPTVAVNSATRCGNGPAAIISATPSPSGTYNYIWTVPSGAANPGNVASFSATFAGTYSVIITNPNTNCTATGSGTLTVNQNPTVTVNSAIKCSNDPAITLTAIPSPSGTYNYAWAVPSGASNPGNVANFSASVTGTYSVIITNPNTNCTGTGSGVLSVNPGPTVTIPDAFAINQGAVANTVYLGYAAAGSLNLTTLVTAGPSPYSYVWSNGSTSSSITVSPTTNTTYSVTVTDANGCKTTVSKNIQVIDIRSANTIGNVIICHKTPGGTNTLHIEQNAVAIHLAHGDLLGVCSTETPTDLKITAAPNPSSNYFIITVEGGIVSENITITISNSLGKIIEKRVNIFTKSFRLGANYLPGIYFIQVSQGKEKASLTLIKPKL